MSAFEGIADIKHEKADIGATPNAVSAHIGRLAAIAKAEPELRAEIE